MALAFTRDEVQWLLRHADSWPKPKTDKGRNPADDLIDR